LLATNTISAPSRLDAIAEQRGVKFQVNRSANMIVITGSKFSTIKAAHDINSIRDTSVSDSFALPVLFPSISKKDSPLNEVRNEDLEAIGALTSTVLSPTNKGTGVILLLQFTHSSCG
jgi:Mitochondrial inner-membrane-bound regulator